VTRRWPAFGLALAVLWLFVRGVPVDPVSGPGEVARDVFGEFLIGLAVGLPVAFVVRRMYPRDLDLTRIPAAIPPGLAYFLVFAKELVLANVEVAYRVLSPSMPIDPEMLEIPLRVESDMGVTTIANSITMTPGTLTMDYDEERNALYVHAIYCEDPADLVDPIRSWEDYALQIFDEPATPDTPAPEPYVYDPDAGGADDGTATETTVDDGGAPDGG